MLHVRKVLTKQEIAQHEEWRRSHEVPLLSRTQREAESRAFFAREAIKRESRNRTVNIPSKDTPGGDTSVIPSQQYSGDAVLGIATMHKSNPIPIFSTQEAIEVATMRRN